MKSPFPKKDKRTSEEIKTDELIERLAAKAATAEECSDVLRLMRSREELRSAKKIKIDPNVVISGAVGIVQVAAILKSEEIRAVTSKAISFVTKGRLR